LGEHFNYNIPEQSQVSTSERDRPREDPKTKTFKNLKICESIMQDFLENICYRPKNDKNRQNFEKIQILKILNKFENLLEEEGKKNYLFSNFQLTVIDFYWLSILMVFEGLVPGFWTRRIRIPSIQISRLNSSLKKCSSL